MKETGRINLRISIMVEVQKGNILGPSFICFLWRVRDDERCDSFMCHKKGLWDLKTSGC